MFFFRRSMVFISLVIEIIREASNAIEEARAAETSFLTVAYCGQQSIRSSRVRELCQNIIDFRLKL